jgi:hypothetical protein
MQFGPKIVTNNLALALDAADMNSYSPNVARSSTDLFNWCQNAAFNACGVSRDTTMTRQYRSIPLKMVVSGNDAYISSYAAPTWNLAPAANGQTWTVSVYVKASVATSGELFIFGADADGYYGGVGTYGSNGAVSITTSWTRVSFTTTMNGVNVAFIQVRLDGPNTGGTGQTIWWDGLQVERSSSPTTFNPYYYGNTIWRDISANNNTGTLTNGAIFNSSNSGNIVFDGVDDYVDLGANLSGNFSSNQITVCAFSKISSVVSKNTLISFNGQFNFFLPGNRLTTTYQLYWDSVSSWKNGNKSDWSTNTWYYLCWTISSTTLTFYVNGVPDGTATLSTSFAPTSSTRIGFANAGEYATGTIANTSVYNRALSAAEVLQNYNTMKNRFGL